jgi:hypothetical protein
LLLRGDGLALGAEVPASPEAASGFGVLRHEADAQQEREHRDIECFHANLSFVNQYL